MTPMLALAATLAGETPLATAAGPETTTPAAPRAQAARSRWAPSLTLTLGLPAAGYGYNEATQMFGGSVALTSWFLTSELGVRSWVGDRFGHDAFVRAGVAPMVLASRRETESGRWELRLPALVEHRWSDEDGPGASDTASSRHVAVVGGAQLVRRWQRWALGIRAVGGASRLIKRRYSGGRDDTGWQSPALTESFRPDVRVDLVADWR